MSNLPDEFNPLPGVEYKPEEVALAQLIVEGVVGISHKITLIPAIYVPTGKRVMTIAIFQPGIEMGTVKIEPVAILLTDPSEVTEPQLEHTDGDGNVNDEAQDSAESDGADSDPEHPG
jgi:hypothetical protein